MSAATTGSRTKPPTSKKQRAKPKKGSKETRKRKLLREMNAELAVVREGGHTVVLQEGRDPVLERRCINRSTFADIKNFYHKPIGTGDNPKTTEGAWWLGHPKRRQFDGVVFAPEQDVPGYFNLWRGFAVEPKKGDWDLYQQHILEVVCADDPDLFIYVLAWMAQGIQHPADRPEVAIVLRSAERGTGKNTFTGYYRELFGQHGIEISNPQHLVGRFNGHLEDACCLVLNEAFWAGSHDGESVLKTLVTEPTISIEHKGFQVRTVKNHLRILMTSNSEWVIPAGLDERRFLVLDVDPKHKQDTTYFGRIAEQMKDGGLAGMLYDLQRHDYSHVDLRTAPQTAALLDQKLLSLNPRERWWFDKLYEGRLLPDDPGWCVETEKSKVHDDYVQELRKTGTQRTRNATELGIWLNKVLDPKLTDTRRSRGGLRVRCWVFPDLSECREIFDKMIGKECAWPPVDLESVKRLTVSPMPVQLPRQSEK